MNLHIPVFAEFCPLTDLTVKRVEALRLAREGKVWRPKIVKPKAVPKEKPSAETVLVARIMRFIERRGGARLVVQNGVLSVRRPDSDSRCKLIAVYNSRARKFDVQTDVRFAMGEM